MSTINSVGNGLSGATGTGNFVGSTSPTLITPALGTPSSGTLTSCTGLPISTGVSGLGTGVATALGDAVNSIGGMATSLGNTSWTPVFTFVIQGDLEVTYTTQNGTYSKVGDIIIATFSITFSSTHTNAQDAALISGLPFAANSSINVITGSVGFNDAVSFPSGTTSPLLILAGGSSSIQITASGSDVNQAGFTPDNFVPSTTFSIQGTITYYV